MQAGQNPATDSTPNHHQGFGVMAGLNPFDDSDNLNHPRYLWYVIHQLCLFVLLTHEL
jgi:hypothetical protein